MTERPRRLMIRVPDEEAKGRSVIVSTVLPAIKGEGSRDYACPGCGSVILEGLDPGQVTNVVFKCPMCGIHSEPPG
jgi:predicted RNA-binding Zn-ribbon protein involved in translation (DUF1610 family)